MAITFRSNALVRKAWATFRRRQLQNDYRRRREQYRVVSEGTGLVYDESSTIASVRGRVAARGYTSPRRTVGDVHTFAFIPDIGWHRHLLPDLRQLGPVTRFDYVAEGFRVEEFYPLDPVAAARREEMNTKVTGCSCTRAGSRSRKTRFGR
jgi:hypothetical protein